MKTSVTLDPEGSRTEPFLMTVTGANHCHDFKQRFDDPGTSWAAARAVGVAERDHLTREGKGW